ncbi:MAG: hypothetical protein DHS20C16_16250 [Phycisphaerae bacterium]|nr:MAG: hypothetical protein DHS20C16_16250 [Phycisphaerae bacterium]
MLDRVKMGSFSFAVMLAIVMPSAVLGQDGANEGGAKVNASAPPEVVAILDRLEQAGKDIHAIRCQVEFKTEDTLNISETTRFGMIQFKRAEPHPMFLVSFDKMVADGIVHKNKVWYLFRDRWLIEANSKSKNRIDREILEPGEKADFFDLDKAPFPMPFGQKKEQILKNFAVKLIPPQPGDPEDCDHLLCKPREESILARDYGRLDYYVSRKLNLPLRILVEDAPGTNLKVADFKDLTEKSINLKLPDGAFVLPKETDEYHKTTEPRRPPPAGE